MEGAGTEVAGVMAISKVVALAYLMFNLFSPPCFAAIGAMNSELKSKKWLFAGIGLQLSIGYTLAFLVSFFGTLFTGGKLGSLWMSILGWGVVFAITVVFVVIILRNRRLSRSEGGGIRTNRAGISA